MSELEKLRTILNPSIKLSQISLSYVNRLFPDLKGSPCFILHKEKSVPKCNQDSPNTEYTNINETSEFDITGSPLKYSFEDDNFEDTLIVVERYWRKEEERYLPLSRTEACNSLNMCLEHLPNISTPIFALCDGKGHKDVRLLGAIIRGEWFTSIEVCSAGTEVLTEIKKSSKFFQEHLKHVQEHNVTISAFNTFNLHGTREETIDWNYNAKSDFEGSLTIEVDSDSLSLYPPTRASKNNLVVQVVTGSDKSPLKELWKQILLLNEYLTILQKYKDHMHATDNQVPLEFPDDFRTPYREECDKIMEDLRELLNGDYRYRNVDSVDLDRTNFETEENVENNVNIEQYVQNLPFRCNLDSTEFLWELLIKNTNCFHMTKCLQAVLENFMFGECLLQENFANATRFGKILSHLDPQKPVTHLLSGGLPLEYIVDMGFEKLCRDYMYILLNTNLCEHDDMKRKFENVSTGEFKIESYRKKLVCMVQFHVCLEFMVLVQNKLMCPTENLGTLFSCAFNEFVSEKSPIQNHNDLETNMIYSLAAPLPVSFFSDLSKEVLSTRRISLTSKTKMSELITTKYYSQLPIFPTSIYPSDDLNTMGATYYITNVICSSNKFK